MNSNRQLVILALSIFLGVLFPGLAAFCKPMLMPVIFLLFTFAILQVQFSVVFRQALFQRACWIVLAWQLVALPLLAGGLLHPWNQSQWYVLAIVTLCTSSITATTAFAKIFSLNDAMALLVCLIGTIVMPLPLFIFLQFISESGAQIDVGVYLNRIFIFIALPFLVVALFRQCISAQTDKRVRDRTPAVVMVLLMIFGLSVMDGVQALMLNDPRLLLSLVVLAFVLNLTVHVMTYIGLRFLNVTDRKTACLLSAYRNMGIVAAIAGPALGEYFFIFVGVWQLPMYTLPLLLKRVYQGPQSILS